MNNLEGHMNQDLSWNRKLIYDELGKVNDRKV